MLKHKLKEKGVEHKVKHEVEVAEHPGKWTMKAVRIHGYGDSSVLKYEEAPMPSIHPDEVLIKVFAAGVNPVDWKIREGYMKERMHYDFPLTLGWDVSGTIERIGSLVTIFKEGDVVIARPDTRRDGCYAEYVAVRAFELALAPTYVGLNEAAGIPLAAQTAWVGLFEEGNLRKRQTVLIHGASGGVGTFAVQLAKIAGAYVYATTSDKNIDMVKSLGADEVINYKEEDFSKKLENLDLVFDTIGGETQAKSWQTLSKKGTLVSTVGADEKEAKKHGVTGKSFMMISNGSRLQEISGLVDKGLVRVIISKEFALEDARAAQDLSQRGHAKGKIILRIQ
jgi:NADPH:quinone reductase-like Zn-dependent oxidoreductase